ncbi:MAG TPA: hypothetical protein VFC56_00400 [Stellaceae bacterium]|nr:hypothetical protein [Stellaceae bacterium]
MVSASEVREAWKEHARLRPIAPTMALTAEGLVLGAGTVLAKRADRDGEPRLAIDGCEERLLALLSIAYGYAVSRAVLGSIRRAARDWSRGETCLAAIHLARSRLPPLPAGEAARFRLFASERLLDDGMAPRQILEDCEIDTAGLDMLKAGFNPAEPRVSAGSGRESGEWTSGGDTGGGDAELVPVAAAEYRTGDPDKFFDTLYQQVHDLAQRLGIDENWLFGLALHESGWLDQHNRELNDPFGVTYGGGINVGYASIAGAIAYWESRFGPVVQGATSAQDFVQRLYAAGYNTHLNWPGLVLRAIGSVPSHLSTWKAKRGI